MLRTWESKFHWANRTENEARQGKSANSWNIYHRKEKCSMYGKYSGEKKLTELIIKKDTNKFQEKS